MNFFDFLKNVLYFLGDATALVSTPKFYFFYEKNSGIWRVNQDGSRDPRLANAMPPKTYEATLDFPLCTAFHGKGLLYRSMSRQHILILREISSKGRLIHKRQFTIFQKNNIFKYSNTIRDIQAAGKQKNKIFVASLKSISFLYYSYKFKKLLSKSTVTDYMNGRTSNSRRFACMAVSEGGGYAFVVQSRMDSIRNAALHVFKVQWSRLLQKIHVFDFGENSSLKPLKGLVCFRGISKRFQTLFGFTCEGKSTLVTLCFDKKINRVCEVKCIRKKVNVIYPIKAEIVCQGEFENSQNWEPVIRLIGRDGQILDVTYFN